MHALFDSQVLDGHSFVFSSLGYGLWSGMVLLSEIVQTSILADFCYYYVKRYVLMHYTDDHVNAYEFEKRTYLASLFSVMFNPKICLQILLLYVSVQNAIEL